MSISKSVDRVVSLAQAFRVTAQHLMMDIDFRDLKWRHHGLGMLQGELSEELRIHLFHPMLRTIPKEGKRDVHDHRFTITSYIVYGHIIDVPHNVQLGVAAPEDPKLSTIIDPNGMKWTLEDAWEIKHSKVQDGNDCTPLGKAWVHRGREQVREQGEVYTIERRAWHTTIVPDFAITLVNRSDFDEGPARILGGCHSAINRDTSQETIGFVVDCAIGAQARAFEGGSKYEPATYRRV